MNRLIFSLSLCLVIVGFSRCTEATIIGGDLLDTDQLPVAFTDTISIQMASLPGDVSTTSSFNLATGSFALGCIEDPKFGISRASIGFSLLERDSQLLTLGITIDSAILVIPLDPAFQLGDTTATVSLRVMQAEPGTIDVDEATTDIPLISTGKVYGELTTVPARRPTRINFFPNSGDTIRRDSVNPQLRIPLNTDFIDDALLALTRSNQLDSGVTEAFRDSVFMSNFSGLIVESSACSPTLPAVSVLGSNGGRFGAILYYTLGTKKYQYSLSFFRSTSSQIAFRPVYEHDYTGSLAGDLLDGTASTDTISLIQSLDGIATRVDLSGVTQLSDVAVTYAILEMPVIRDGFSEPIIRIIPRRLNSVGDFADIGAGNSTVDAAYTTTEGGLLVKIKNIAPGATDSIEMYRFNLTAHVQKIVDGERDPEIFLLPFSRVQIPGRSIIAGPMSTGHKTRLLLATTKLP